MIENTEVFEGMQCQSRAFRDGLVADKQHESEIKISEHNANLQSKSTTQIQQDSCGIISTPRLSKETPIKLLQYQGASSENPEGFREQTNCQNRLAEANKQERNLTDFSVDITPGININSEKGNISLQSLKASLRRTWENYQEVKSHTLTVDTGTQINLLRRDISVLIKQTGILWTLFQELWLKSFGQLLEIQERDCLSLFDAQLSSINSKLFETQIHRHTLEQQNDELQRQIAVLQHNLQREKKISLARSRQVEFVISNIEQPKQGKSRKSSNEMVDIKFLRQLEKENQQLKDKLKLSEERCTIFEKEVRRRTKLKLEDSSDELEEIELPMDPKKPEAKRCFLRRIKRSIHGSIKKSRRMNSRSTSKHTSKAVSRDQSKNNSNKNSRSNSKSRVELVAVPVLQETKQNDKCFPTSLLDESIQKKLDLLVSLSQKEPIRHADSLPKTTLQNVPPSRGPLIMRKDTSAPETLF